MVGSSSSSRSGSEKSTAASATRMRQPPEYSESGRRCAGSSKPSPLRIRAARAGAVCASMSTRRVWISAMRSGSIAISASAFSASRSASAESTKSMRLSGPPGASCSTLPMRAPLGAMTAPLSGARSPRMRRKSVVLPAPLRPTSPTRAPEGSAALALSIKQTLAEPIGKAVDMEHGELLARRARAGKIERALRVRLTGPTARRPSGKKPNGARAAQRGHSEQPRGPTRFDHARGVAFAWAPAI